MWTLSVTLILGLAGLISADTYAQCDLTPNPNRAADSPTVTGRVLFHQETGNPTVIYNVIAGGFPSSESGTLHGFHVHEKGNMTDGCESTGSHFNPEGVNHGGPQDTIRHVGDLGNIQVTPEGSIDVQLSDSVISLEARNTNSIMRRAIVVHADPDDLGRGGFDDSLTTGHAGARLACCVITPITADEYNNP